MNGILRTTLLLLSCALLWLMPGAGRAQDQDIYTDQLVNGWEDWGWASLDYANTSPVHGGSRSIRVTTAGWENANPSALPRKGAVQGVARMVAKIPSQNEAPYPFPSRAFRSRALPTPA